MSVMVTAPVRNPVCVGANCIFRVQVFPAATELPLAQEPFTTFWEKSPLTAIVLMFSVALPELVRVTVFDEAVVPTFCPLNVNEVGESFTFGPLIVMERVVE